MESPTIIQTANESIVFERTLGATAWFDSRLVTRAPERAKLPHGDQVAARDRLYTCGVGGGGPWKAATSYENVKKSLSLRER